MAKFASGSHIKFHEILGLPYLPKCFIDSSKMLLLILMKVFPIANKSFFNFTELDANPGTSKTLFETGDFAFIIDESGFVRADDVESDFVDVVIFVAGFKSFDDVIGRVFESIDNLDNAAFLFQDFSDAPFVWFKLHLESK